MKLYREYKKQFNFILVVLFFLFSTFPFYSYAQTAEDLQTKINQKDADIAILEKEIASYQSELDTIGKQKNSLSSAIMQLDITRKKLVADINVTQKKIDKTNLKIQNLSSDINTKQHTINNNTEAISQLIKQTNELENGNLLESILSNESIGAVWNDIDHMIDVHESIRADIVKLKKVKGELEDKKQVNINQKNELTTLKSSLKDQQNIVIQNTNEKNRLLKETKNNEANYQKLLKTQMAKKEAFEKELRNYEAQLKFILDPSKLPNGGVLSWPLERIYVTQEFGAKTGPHRTYASGHSGTDFRARTPQPVMSMADGIVKGVGDTDLSCPGVSFGRFVFIEYNNGLSSTFGHLSLIKVYEGQRVSRGEVVGYTGGTGRVTGPHLHVSLYASSAVSVQTIPSKSCPGRILKQPVAPIAGYLDPMYYLPPYSPQP